MILLTLDAEHSGDHLVTGINFRLPDRLLIAVEGILRPN
jgi:hypothetical protein